VPGATGALTHSAFPSIKRRLASMVYESLLLFGIVFFAGLLFHLAIRTEMTAAIRHVFQLYLLVVIGVYFIWFWRHGGQTLAMKTWKLRLVDTRGAAISLRRAIARYLYACAGIGLGGIGICYALFDRERLFLHDRLAGTRIVQIVQQTGS
jgi:uncharacterized RDD family membrane protein YckC